MSGRFVARLQYFSAIRLLTGDTNLLEVRDGMKLSPLPGYLGCDLGQVFGLRLARRWICACIPGATLLPETCKLGFGPLNSLFSRRPIGVVQAAGHQCLQTTEAPFNGCNLLVDRLQSSHGW